MKTIFMMIFSIHNLIWTIYMYKISKSKIELYFIKIFTQMIISCNSLSLFLVWWSVGVSTDVGEPKNVS